MSLVYRCGCLASGVHNARVCPEHGEPVESRWEGLHRIVQPEGTKYCGQACVAMVLGISLSESLDLFGHSGGTYPREVAAVLRLSGYACPPKFSRSGGKNLPDRCLCRVRYVLKETGNIYKRVWHWVVWWDGKMYDPSDGTQIYKYKITGYMALGG